MTLRSMRKKATWIIVCAMVAVMILVTVVGAIAIRGIGKTDSNHLLMQLCESGEKSLDYYFDGVEKSVQMVSAYVESDLEGLAPDQLDAHIERAKDVFAKMTHRTNGVLTYYYRIDPEVSEKEKGFWFVNLYGEGFTEHKVTDITLYDTDDTSQLVWFTVPKEKGEPVWLPPYITENLGERVISYNVPVRWRGRFIGVIGIEIDYTTVAEQVNSISLYDDGYAFLTDDEGRLIYHPLIDVTTTDEPLVVPDKLMSNEDRIRYTYEGTKKDAVWLPLSNGMRLYVTVPVSQIDAEWVRLIWLTTFVSIALMLVLVFITLRFTRRITRPLQELAEVAECVNEGDYSREPTYKGDDEIGTIAAAFRKLLSHMSAYMQNINNRAYVDALTSVRNKGAYDVYMNEMQRKLEKGEALQEFGVCVFDCNNLREINEQAGYDKGDLYLKLTCALICDVFDHSPVFRLGGDEFAVILCDTDYRDRDQLITLIDDACAERQLRAKNIWERLDIACGLAVYDPNIDDTVNDVVRRADKLMYENKWKQKGQSV